MLYKNKNSIKFFLFFSLFLLLINNNSIAQYFYSGQDAASTKWREIKSENFKIIYPEDFESESQRLANIINRVYNTYSKELKIKPERFPVIIHNQSILSNGFVGYAPKRVELFSIPPQDIYSQDWLEQLATHEYRHVFQYAQINKSTTKFLSYFFGQQIIPAIFGTYIPFWFIEGDAVCSETQHSFSGRGRVPYFEMKLKAQVLQKGIYSYDKANFSSYKNYVPSIYHLGYSLVAYSKLKYGDDFCSRVYSEVAKKPYSITPFANSIKKITGKSKLKYYKSTLLYLDSLWRKQNNEVVKNEYVNITKQQKYYTNYLHANIIDDSTIVTEKNSLDDISRFVKINSRGDEEILFTPGYYFKGTLSYSNNLISWLEIKYDLRWENRNNSVIKIYNLKTKKLKTINFNNKLFAPVLSHDGSMVAAVEVSSDNKYYLSVVDVKSGKLIKTISTKNNYFFINPSWSEDDKNIISVVLTDKGKSLAITNITNSDTKILIPFSYHEISKPVQKGRHIYFVAAYSGIDNIYVFDIFTKNIYQITSAEFGAADPVITNNNKIIYSDYSSSGYRIVKASTDSNLWIPLENIKDNSIEIYQKTENKNYENLQKNNEILKHYSSKKYSKIKNLINIHSWGPLSVNTNNQDIYPGISLMSQNDLSTCFANIGYKYNYQDNTDNYYASLSYHGFYPVFYTNFEYNQRKENVLKDGENRKIEWFETSLKTGIRLPFNFTKGKYSRYLQTRIQYNYTKNDFYKTSGLSINSSELQTIDYRIYSYSLLKSNFKDMYPRWGQVVEINYRHFPFKKYTGNIFSFETNLFFPGLINHHSLKLYFAYQEKTKSIFQNIINYARGYSYISENELMSLSVNYKFPVFYPDFSLSSLLFVKRIKANLFYDYSFNKNFDCKSFGVELFSDVHIIRFLIPFEIGLRTSYIPDKKKFENEFLIFLNINAL